MVVSQIVSFVPWSEDSEWLTVRNQILSEEMTQLKKAYETMLMWKLKHNDLPAYIESTLSLLQVIVKEHKLTFNDNGCLNVLEEHDLQLAYSTALLRFVNHVSSVAANKGESLYWSAKTQNIPDWIVNMRHEIAHSQDLPTIDAFHAAVNISLKWLLDNYWLKNKVDTSQVFKTNFAVSKGNCRAFDLFRKAFEVWDHCVHMKKKYIGEAKPEFIVSLQELLNIKNAYFCDVKPEETKNIQKMLDCSRKVEENNLSYIETNTVNEFKLVFLKFLKTLIKDKNNHNFLVSSLLDSSFSYDNDFKPRKWQKIIQLIQNAKLLQSLLENLFEMAGNGNEKACKWLLVLYPSMKLLRKKWAMFKVLTKENKNSNSRQIKMKLRSIKSDTDRSVVVHLNVAKPPVITMKMMNGVLLNTDAEHCKKLSQYLRFVKPALPETTMSLIKDLVQIHGQEIDGKCKGRASNEKIYTLDDLVGLAKEDQDCADEKQDEEDEEAGWKRSETDIRSWIKCPLGLLPFQAKVNCELPSDHVWIVENPKTMNKTKHMELFGF